MKLLVITQKVDRNDPILGFFHRWLEEFAKHYESLIVICLEKPASTRGGDSTRGGGDYDLPENVSVYSLGKLNIENSLEIGNWKLEILAKFKYVWNFYKYIFKYRHDYDAVFVHMNQEYVLLAGDLWRLMGKKVYLWRNHAKGNIWTRLAVQIADKVFYTSPQSFTAQFKKAIRMPAGIDTDFFKPDPRAERIPNSLLFLGRIASVKKVLEFIDYAKSTDCIATIAGPIGDEEYGKKVKLKIENSKLKINYIGPVTQAEAKTLYQTHETYVNFTPAGSFDKTIIEAAACGCKLKVENPDLQNINPAEHSLKKLMEKLRVILDRK